jgi:ubiquinone/menaquinone biosynthesis C-methylase UbiE/broad specificity phosphatase PhoE
MRLLLICHAEGMQERYSDLGARNGGLTALGWEQSDALANWLRSHCLLDVIVADTRLQSRLTAQRIGQGLAMPVTVFRELPPVLGQPVLQAVTPRFEARPDGSSGPTRNVQPLSALAVTGNVEPTEARETYADYQRELIKALDQLVAEHWGKTVALITGREVISAVLHYVLGASSPVETTTPAAITIRMDHTGVSELRHQASGWCVCYVNRLEHVPTPVLPAQDTGDLPPSTAETVENLATVIRIYNRVAATPNAEKREADLERMHHLVNFAKLPADQQILDIGTGLGILPLVLAEEGAHTVVGIDVSPGMLEQAEYHRLQSGANISDRVSFRLAAAQALPFHDERFDAVFCRLVLNHAQKPEQIIREVVRVLRPGGVLILAELLSVDNSVKRATQNAIEERRNPAHVAARSAEQYAKMLDNAGLVIEGQEAVSFDRELEEWLNSYAIERGERVVVREMIEAGIETDAAGIGARRQGDAIVFVQRMCYLRAVKPASAQVEG